MFFFSGGAGFCPSTVLKKWRKHTGFNSCERRTCRPPSKTHPVFGKSVFGVGPGYASGCRGQLMWINFSRIDPSRSCWRACASCWPRASCASAEVTSGGYGGVGEGSRKLALGRLRMSDFAVARALRGGLCKAASSGRNLFGGLRFQMIRGRSTCLGRDGESP